jgi:DNA-binding winged helix-turn-helix (wHTH) protein/TolB-like protein/Flp pilus assembly protein TadD
MSSVGKHFYEFGPFRIDVAERRLLHGGQAVPLTPKVFDTLLLLVENSGRTLEKDELIERLWPDSFVEESSLAQNIFQLRKALGEAGSGERYIETIPKRGYRFAANVRELRPGADADLLVKRHSETVLILEEEEESRNGDVGNAKEAEKQIQAHEFSSYALRGWQGRRLILISSLALIIVLSAGLYFWRRSVAETTEAAKPDTKAIAVLPFKPLDSESSDEQLRLGMADALISRLSNLRQFVVRPTSAILIYRDAWQDARETGRELQVDMVLDGTIQRAGDRLRVSVQLVRVRDGVPIWSEKFDEQSTDALAIQDSISEQVASRLLGRLSEDARTQLVKRYTENTEAYQSYIRGRYFWNKRTEEGFRKGIEHFRQAIEIDPGYALAYVGLADCYFFLAYSQYGNVPPKENFERARAAALKALELDESLAEAYTTLGVIYSDSDGDWSRAEKAYLRAIELNPNYATARHWYALDLLAAERFDEALEQMRKAKELDPLSLNINLALGQLFFYTRRYDDAIKQLEQTLDLDAHHAASRLYLGMAYEQKGMQEKANAEFQKILERYETHGGALSARAHTDAVTGMRAKAQRALVELEKRPILKPILMYDIAVVHAALGDEDQAFRWLRKIPRDPSKNLLIRLKFDPRSARLRSDPRFETVLNARSVPAHNP